MNKAAVFCALGMCFFWGCVEQSQTGSRDEQRVRQQYVSTTAPTPQHPLDIRFEDKIRLVGYDLDPPANGIRPGRQITITWYWRCDRPIESGWQLFTHVEDAARTPRINLDNEGAIRQSYQPGRWRRGEYVKDVQTVTFNQDWNSPAATFMLGLWQDTHRLHVVHGASDGHDRAEALTIRTGITPGGGAQPHTTPTPPPAALVPALTARRATQPPRLDGHLDDAVWREARPSARFVDTMSGAPAEPEAKVQLAWDDRNLYIAFTVADDNLHSTFTRRDDHLWEQDAVEVMIDPDGDGRNYVELQVSPTGQVFDTRYDSPRNPAAPGHVDYEAHVRAFVDRREGTLNDDSDTDRGYVVEMSVPWNAFETGETPIEPPHHGAVWRMNFFVMDIPHGSTTQRAVAWSPPRVGDFHTLARFGRIMFIDPAAMAQQPGMAIQPGQQAQLAAQGAVAGHNPALQRPVLPNLHIGADLRRVLGTVPTRPSGAPPQ